MTDDTDQLISATLLRLRMRSPFFATLALFARVRLSDEIETAATDGRTVFVNPDYFQLLSGPEQDQLILHRVLHAALLHVTRRGERDPEIWNIAGDIIVNGIIAGIAGMELPADAVRDQRLEQLSVEEAYEVLLHDPDRPIGVESDLLEPPDGWGRGQDGSSEGSIATARNARLEAYWRDAHQHATVVALAVAHGTRPAGLARELEMLNPARLDWRAYLWRYVAQTPTDFQGYDRRFIGRGLYLDAMESESLRVCVAVDTSGSVDDRQVQTLVSEVQGILRAYPHVQCELYYADAQVYGPFPLAADSPIPPPIGGGGTDFRPFFTAVTQRYTPNESTICIYLTDGFGDFPAEPPELPVLWVVTAAGRALDRFPFGEAVRLLI
jgi:predicted metal-dependent peptidase